MPVLGFGISPRGPSTRPMRPTKGIMSGVAMARSKLKIPFSISAARSSAPTMSAPALRASSAASPVANTATRMFLPVPDGNATVPRTACSALRGSTPRRIATSMVSSNLADASDFTKVKASVGLKCASRSKRFSASVNFLPDMTVSLSPAFLTEGVKPAE